MGKNSFLLYTSDYKCIKDLPLEQKGALLDAIFEYASTGTIIDLPPIVSMAFNFFRSHIDDNTKKWNEKVADIEDSYYKKFSAMEVALSKLQSQMSSFTSMLG